MLERLQKILSQAGVASRREAEGIILEGRVAVNGEVVTELGVKADPETDAITVDGKRLSVKEKRLYVLLYKPVGYVTTMKDPQGRPVVSDLLKSVPARVYPVGRLDYNTEGLLVLTNDGALAHALMHPSHQVDKGYLVRVSGQVSESQLERLREGVRLEDGLTAPAVVTRISESAQNSWISITIHEGRFRQVRRMCEAVGLSVVRLKRSRYDFLEIGELTPGEHRILRPDEVERLKRHLVAPPSGRMVPRYTPEQRGESQGTRGPGRRGEPGDSPGGRDGAPKGSAPRPGGAASRRDPRGSTGGPRRGGQGSPRGGRT